MYLGAFPLLTSNPTQREGKAGHFTIFLCLQLLFMYCMILLLGLKLSTF